jgi:hypothetical protein
MAGSADHRGVIAFVSCVGTQSRYDQCVVPGLRRAIEPDSVVATVATTTSIHEAYNQALDHFAQAEGLEALVLLHEDVEILTDDFCTRLRHALSDPEVAICGPIGARDVPGLAWWEGEMAGRVGDTRGLLEKGFDPPEVDALDGLMLALSPWAVQHLRFDAATYGGFHAYDMDICFAARAAGRKVIVADVPVMHYTKTGFGDQEAWLANDAAFRRKWGLPPRTAAAA